MRILFLNPVGVLGGAERVLLDLFEPLQRVDPGIDLVLVTGTDGPLVARAAALGVITEVVAMPPSLTHLGEHGFNFRNAGAVIRALASAAEGGGEAAVYLGRIARAIRRFEPSLIHSNGIKTHLLSALFAPRNVPIVWHLHDFVGDRALASHALRATARLATSAIANSDAVAKDARQVLGPRIPIDVVHNAINTAHYAPGAVDAASLDRLGGVAPAPVGTVRVGLVGTYARWKGHELFLEAIKKVLARNLEQRARFYIVGGPIYRTAGSQFSETELREQARRAGIAEHVVFVPFQEDLSDVYRALDVVVHASTRREPFGMVIVEAMATACAVVVADAGGAAELFRHGEDALGYEMGNADALASAMQTLIADEGYRAQLGERARRAAITHFSRDRIGAQLEKIYRGVLEKSRARS